MDFIFLWFSLSFSSAWMLSILPVQKKYLVREELEDCAATASHVDKFMTYKESNGNGALSEIQNSRTDDLI